MANGSFFRVWHAFYARRLDAFAANGVDPPVPAHVLGPAGEGGGVS